jgi:methyl-accepting chemotaxis protein
MSESGKRIFVGGGKGYLNAAGPQFRFILFMLIVLVVYTLLLLVFQKLAGFLPFLVFFPIALVSIFLFIGVTGIVYSHKFVGPMARIRKAIERLIEGDISISLRLRDSDDPMLKDLVKAIARLADHTRNTRTLVHETAQDLFADLAVLKEKIQHNGDAADIQKQIEVVQKRRDLLDKALQLTHKS